MAKTRLGRAIMAGCLLAFPSKLEPVVIEGGPLHERVSSIDIDDDIDDTSLIQIVRNVENIILSRNTVACDLRWYVRTDRRRAVLKYKSVRRT